ncbi:Lrp/AsnC family transcriptional regulator [Herbiconiux moechotypicola]|uniref:Lrp/AsnC family transcriptional regulator n=1 Tax=Herbiconiux moechotypicola TaxID=637393 RepID=A0ABN3D9T9_9MICO|nr:Lrp/AsnC family transcriptional regulator [Herbiconiux moechotypicola]MCS5729095.1 Lrp/AsnC family transcriptional regulator [Herbiconiux moechotypicola]
MEQLDDLDARILLALDADPDATVLGLAHALGVARNTVHARLRRMAASGALGSFSKRIDPAALGYPLVAYVWIAVSQASNDPVVEGLQKIAQIVEIHTTTGDADLLVKVVARDPAHLHRLTRQMLAVEGVMRTNTTLSLVESMPHRVRALLEERARE